MSLRRGSSATLFTGCSFWDNSAVNGGAIGGAFATAALHSSTILLNEAASNVSTVPFSSIYQEMMCLFDSALASCSLILASLCAQFLLSIKYVHVPVWFRAEAFTCKGPFRTC